MDSNDPIIAALRGLGMSLATILATKGWMDAASAQTAIGALITLGLLAWGIYSKRKVAIIASAASRLNPNIPSQRIVTDPATAAAIPSHKVTAS